MRWIDCAGVPGVGKSAVLDERWPRRIVWDGLPPPHEWQEFVKTTERFASMAHEPDVLLGIVTATINKVATIARRDDPAIYVQTGLAQIGLELGWRLNDQAVAAYYEIMPVSLGVVFLSADLSIVQSRNRARTRDFAERVPAMDRARVIGERVLTERGVSLLTLNTILPVEFNRSALHEFANS